MAKWLLGEYVIEIIEPILERFSYRHRFATCKEYPGLMALAALKQQYPRSENSDRLDSPDPCNKVSLATRYFRAR